MSETGFGVIGVGTWGELHAKVYSDLPGGYLAAVCDANPQRAEQVGKACGAQNIYSDYQKMLADPNVHAVSVVLPDFMHRKAVVACAEAGKHVLVEKPLATSEEDGLAMIAAAKASGVHLFVDFHTRWSPLFAQLKDAHDAGDLGESQMIYYRVSNTTFVATQMLKWANRSSVAWFLGSHCLDTLLWLMNARAGADNVERLYCVSRSRVLKGLGVDTPDFFQTTLEWRSGLVTQMENVWILPESGPSIVDSKFEWIGSKGAVHIDGSHHGAIQKQTVKKASYPDAFVLPTVQGRPAGYGAESIRHFARSIINGQKPIVDGLDGLAVTRLILKMEESVQSRAPVEVGPLFDE